LVPSGMRETAGVGRDEIEAEIDGETRCGATMAGLVAETMVKTPHTARKIDTKSSGQSRPNSEARAVGEEKGAETVAMRTK